MGMTESQVLLRVEELPNATMMLGGLRNATFASGRLHRDIGRYASSLGGLGGCLIDGIRSVDSIAFWSVR